MSEDKLTPEQIKNWRRILSLQFGAYAYAMPETDIQSIKDKIEKETNMEGKDLVFKCPQCSGNRLETVFDGVHSCEITRIDPDGDHDSGEIQSEAMVDRVQCLNCGYVLSDECGSISYEEIGTWLKNNVPQE